MLYCHLMAMYYNTNYHNCCAATWRPCTITLSTITVVLPPDGHVPHLLCCHLMAMYYNTVHRNCCAATWRPSLFCSGRPCPTTPHSRFLWAATTWVTWTLRTSTDRKWSSGTPDLVRTLAHAHSVAPSPALVSTGTERPPQNSRYLKLVQLVHQLLNLGPRHLFFVHNHTHIVLSAIYGYHGLHTSV